MKVLIEKELTNPVYVDGIAQVLGPHYHIYSVDENGNKTFVKTIDQDIKEAAREAERMLDLNVLEVAYKEKGPDSFKSSIDLPPEISEKFRYLATCAPTTNVKLENGTAYEEGCVDCSKHYF